MLTARAGSSLTLSLVVVRVKPAALVYSWALRFMMPSTDESTVHIACAGHAFASSIERPLLGLASTARGSERPAWLVARLGEGCAAPRLPRGDRRRRRTRPRHGLLPC